jgi:hypothetical protein
MIEAKDVLDWCFTLASLDFGVFGFLYSTYAAAMFQLSPDNPVPPPITRDLKRFCWAIVLVLVVLTVVSVATSYTAGVGLSVWVIVFCFVVLTGFSLLLVSGMN